MESFNIFKGKGYDKVNHLEDQSQSQPRKHHITTVAISAILLLTLVIGFMVAALIHESITELPEEEEAAQSLISNSAEAIKAICSVTHYPESCFTSISSLNTPPPTKLDPELIFNLSLHVSINQLKKLSSTFKSLKDLHHENAALADCVSQLDDALNQFSDSVKKMRTDKQLLTKGKMNDIQTWISAAMTNQETCVDGLEEMGSSSSTIIDDQVKAMLQKSKEYTSNNLAIVANMQILLQKFGLTLH